uniref:ARAD1D31966p n=1 Tax=Blastobotrys adeninivorans TaxID=409370 RepID=A0A060TGM9_BLAAD
MSDEQNDDEHKVQHVARALVKTALCLEYGRNKISRTDVLKALVDPSSTMSRSARIDTYKSALREANTRLQEQFGMKLVALPEKTTAEGGSGRRAKAKKRQGDSSDRLENADDLVLVSTLDEKYRRLFEASEGDSYTGYIAVSLLFLALFNGSMPKPKLIELFRLKLQITSDDHIQDAIVSPFAKGNGVEALVLRMRRDGYVTIEKIATSQTTEEIVSIGPRAKVEFTVESLYNVYTEIYGQTNAGVRAMLQSHFNGNENENQTENETNNNDNSNTNNDS